jgi:hypothetical protein
MYEFIAMMLIPANFFYFAVCFFQPVTESRNEHTMKLFLTFSLAPASFSYFFKAFETLQVATPLQLMFFVSTVLVFIAAGKVFVQYPRKSKESSKSLHQSS